MWDSTKKSSIAEQLGEALDSSRVLMGEPLSKHTSFKIGGPADIMVLPVDLDEIVQVLSLGRDHNIPVYCLGNGSNVLVSDAGLHGIVIKLSDNFSRITIENTLITCQCGATNKQVADAARDAGLSGYEFASGIPGSIGGAAFMNAGAYDGEFSQVAHQVTCLTPELKLVELSKKQAQWSYRHSLMMDKKYLVVEAQLCLKPDKRDAIDVRMRELKAQREAKQPLEEASAGSTFKRPVGNFAGKLIRDAGMQGKCVGGAQVSMKHAGFIINTGNATAADVRALISEVQSEVYRTSGVMLEPEIRMWGFDDISI